MRPPFSLTNEMTGMLGREWFDEPPGDVTGPHDIERWHQFRRSYHRAQALDGPGDFPLQVDVELHTSCNLHCTFCEHGQKHIPYQMLDRRLLRRVIDEGADHGLVSMKFNYINEPLMAHDLSDLVRYAKSRGVLNVYFATNGILMDERRCRELIDAGVSKVMISRDATTTETYLSMRQSRHFDLVIRNVLALLDLRSRLGVSWPLVRVNFLKTNLNIHEAEDFIRRWHGVADVIGFQDQIGLPGVANDLLRDAEYVDHSEFRCSFPYKMLVVDARGYILPCCTFSGREMPLGHVADMKLAEAWRSKQMTDLKNQHLNFGWRDNPVCAHCVLGNDSGSAAASAPQLIQLAKR